MVDPTHTPITDAEAEAPVTDKDVGFSAIAGSIFQEAQGVFPVFLGSLIARGDDVNVQDENGMTPLHHAAARGAREAVRLLVACGRCDYLIPDRKGRYAFELAREFGRDRGVAELLEKKHAQQAFQRGVPAYVPKE